jgi:hypothetical protein
MQGTTVLEGIGAAFSKEMTIRYGPAGRLDTVDRLGAEVLASVGIVVAL